MPSLSRVLLYGVWFGMFGPLIGAMIASIVVLTFNTPMNVRILEILIETLVLCILFAYVIWSIPAVLTGIFSSFIKLPFWWHCLITGGIGALLSCIAMVVVLKSYMMEFEMAVSLLAGFIAGFVATASLWWLEMKRQAVVLK